MPYFKQEILEASNQKGDLNSTEYTDALKKSTSAREILDKLMNDHKLDVICAVSYGIPGCTDVINGDYSTGFYFASPAAMAGFPHITVPMGHVHDLPVGFSVMGRAYEEEKIISVAYAYEQASKKRKAPKFLQTFSA